MRILVSNDDGIGAEGLRTLIENMDGVGDIFICVPDRERSAAGHSITVHHPIRAREINCRNFGLSARGWITDGTPADCVKLAIDDLLPGKPDLVVAGINHGPNLGTDVMYSGTVSAAIEGVIDGIPAVAVSLSSYGKSDFTCAGRFSRWLIKQVLKRGLPAGVLLNVNVPLGWPNGVKVTKLGRRRYVNVIHKRTDPRGRPYYWMAGDPVNLDESCMDTDICAITDGWISVTPVQLDLTDYSTLERLKTWPFCFKEGSFDF